MFCGHKLRTSTSTQFNAVLNIPIFLTFFQKRNAQVHQVPTSFHQHPKTFKNQGSLTFLALLCFKFLKITWERPQRTTPVFTHPKKTSWPPFRWAVQFHIQRFSFGVENLLDYLSFWRTSFLVWDLLKDVENPETERFFWIIFISDWWSVPFCCDPSGISFVVVWRQIFPGEQKNINWYRRATWKLSCRLPSNTLYIIEMECWCTKIHL